MATWFQRLTQAISREYDRRIRRASQVTEYGATHAPHADPHDEDEGEVEILNVPRGTSFSQPARDNHHGATAAPDPSQQG